MLLACRQKKMPNGYEKLILQRLVEFNHVGRLILGWCDAASNRPPELITDTHTASTTWFTHDSDFCIFIVSQTHKYDYPLSLALSAAEARAMFAEWWWIILTFACRASFHCIYYDNWACNYYYGRHVLLLLQILSLSPSDDEPTQYWLNSSL